MPVDNPFAELRDHRGHMAEAWWETAPDGTEYWTRLICKDCGDLEFKFDPPPSNWKRDIPSTSSRMSNRTNGSADLNWDEAQEVPAKVLARFADKTVPTRSLGHALRAQYGSGKYVIRRSGGKIFAVPKI